MNKKERGEQYVQVKVKTQWGRRRALRIYEAAVRRRNIKIEDLQVEVQRLRALLDEQTVKEFDERYADEDRTGKRNADKNLRRQFPWAVTEEERKALETTLKKLRAEGNRGSSLKDYNAPLYEKLTSNKHAGESNGHKTTQLTEV